jgi:hypothetical protein
MDILLNTAAVVDFTVNDTIIQNSLRYVKAPITDWLLHDSGTHTVSRNSPSKIVLTRQTTGSSNAVVVFPPSTDVPDGLEVQVFVWMLSGRTGTGSQLCGSIQLVQQITPLSLAPLAQASHSEVRLTL